MAFVDDPNTNSQEVASSTPLSNEAPMESSQEPSQSSAPSTPMQSSSQPSEASTKLPKGSGRASSGMYTNIQKYVDKNKPQAQNMSQAASQNVEKQASSIRNAAQQKADQQKSVIDANRAMVDQQRQEAQNIVNQQLSGQAPQDQNQAERFQQLMSGPQGTQEVGRLNIAQQENRANALSQLAQGANTEQGRRNLLKDTFQKQGDYTSGMSGLDQLIVGGDEAARKQLQGTSDIAENLNTGLTEMAQQAQGNLGEYNRTASDFGGQVRAFAENPQAELDANVTQAYEQALAERAAIFGEDSPEYQQALASAQSRLDQMGKIGGGSLSDFTKYVQNQMKSGTGLGWKGADHANIQNALDNLNQFAKTGQIAVKDGFRTKVLKGNEAREYLRKNTMMGTNKHKQRQQIRELSRALNKNIIGSDAEGLYGTKSLGMNRGDLNLYNMYENIKNQYEGLGSADDIVRRNLSDIAGGQSFEDITSGADIQKYDVASQDQINKINALKGLLGQQDTITEEQLGGQEYTSTEDIKNLLSRFG